MRVKAIRIPCKSLSESEAFYSNLLDSESEFGSEREGWVGLRLENVTILLEMADMEEFEAGRYLGFSIEVDDIHAFYKDAVAKGVTFTGPPMKQPWGGTMTHVEDCNGNIFSIVQDEES